MAQSLVFESIRYRNLLSSGQTWIEINLSDPGSFLILGSNGSGKSTVAEAITFALFNRAYRKIRKSQLVNSINKRDCLVEVRFRTGGNFYLIRRGIKPNIFEVYCNNKLLNQEADSDDYQEYLEKHILKTNLKSFKQYVILGSASYTPFMELNPGERRKVVEDLLDVEIFSGMLKLLGKLMQADRERLRELELRIESGRDKVKLIRNNIDRFMTNTSELIATKQQSIQEYKASGLKTLEESKELTVRLKELTATFNDRSTKVRQAWEKETGLKAKVTHRQKDLSKDLEFFNHTSDCPTCAQSITDEYKAGAISKRVTTLAELGVALVKVTERLDKIATAQSKLRTDQRNIASLETHLAELKAAVRFTKGSIEGLQSEIEQLREQKLSYDVDETAIGELQDQVRQHMAEKKDLADTSDLYKIAQILLKDTGIKAQIIKQYVPIINRFINKYLAAMDFFVGFELDENFNEKILSRHRDEFSYASFSQGEKFRLDLALLLTWRAIASVRNTSSCSLLLMDETFDSALDDAGLDSLVKIMDELIADGNSVIVISHRGDQLVDKFDNIMKFSKVRNFTQMEVQ